MKKLIFTFVLIISNCLFAQSISLDFQNAMEAFNKGDFSKSVLLFENLIEKYSNNNREISSSEFYLAESLMGLKEYDGAASRFESFVSNYEMSSYRDLALYRLGTIYFNNSSYELSRKKFLELIDLYKTSEFVGSSFYWVGESYANQNKYNDAEKYFKEAISTKNNKYLVNSIYSLANVYEKTNQYKNAVTYYDELLAYHRKHELAVFAQMRIGISYFKLKEYDSVVLELNDPLINELPIQEQKESKTILANTYFRLKEYDNAAKTYESIIELYEESENIRNVKYDLAFVNFHMNEYEQAYKIFSEIARTENDSLAQFSMYWSGECKRYLNENEVALSIFERFFEKYPESELIPKVMFNSGIIYFQKNNHNKSEKLLVTAIDSKDLTTKIKALTLLGEISLNRKDFTSATNYFNNALKNDVDDIRAKNRLILGLSICQYYKNEFDSALEKLSELNGDYPNFEKDLVNFYLAEILFANGDFSKSLTHYSRVNLSNLEFSDKALYGKAYAYFNMKDYANAAFYFNDFLKKYKNSKNALDAKFRLAESYYGTKNFEESSDIYKNLFEQTRSKKIDDFSYYQYGQSLFKAGKTKEAINEFHNLQKKYPRSKFNDDSQYLIGWIYFQSSDFTNAIKNYEEIFNKYPNSAIRPIAYYSIGDSYYNLSEYDSALVYYNKIISYYPNTQFVFDAINGIQYCYMAKDQPDNAISIIDIYVANNPQAKYTDQVLYKKGEIYYSLGSYEKAVDGYSELITTYPNSNLMANAYYWIGKASSQLNNIDIAIRSYDYVIKNYIKSDVGIGAVLELSKIYESQNNFVSAIELYSSTISGMPGSKRVPELLFAKGNAQKNNNELQQAYESFNEIITYYDQTIFSAKSKIELGKMELERNSFENAELLFKELGEKRTDDLGAQAQYFYGVTLFNQEKTKDAVSAFVRVRSVFSGYDEWYSKSLLKLGDCYVKLKDKNNARDMYRAVVKRNKNDELGREANKKLRNL